MKINDDGSLPILPNVCHCRRGGAAMISSSSEFSFASAKRHMRLLPARQASPARWPRSQSRRRCVPVQGGRQMHTARQPAVCGHAQVSKLCCRFSLQRARARRSSPLALPDDILADACQRRSRRGDCSKSGPRPKTSVMSEGNHCNVRRESL